MTKKYLRPDEAAEYLSVPLNTLAYWRCRCPDKGPRFSRPERRVVLYDIAELDAWAAKGGAQ